MKRRAMILGTLGTAALGTAVATKGKPFLVIGGKVGLTNDNSGIEFRFSEAEFMQLKQKVINTATAWTPLSRWEGPRMDDVMRHVGAKGAKQLRVAAIDDYAATIPWADMERWGIILAHSRNGERLKPNRWGPLFVIYPRDEYERELRTPMTEAKFIWQVRRIDVE